ncbi:MAG: lipopolysaccharide biosynthesis protein [Nitritalea sp.]
MSQLVTRFQQLLGIKSDRTKNISVHVLKSLLFKGGMIASSFILVPLTLNFLTKEAYGVWLTLTSFLSWFTFFDVGLGNGLRNKLAEALTEKDQPKARAYVSAAYLSIGSISFLLVLLLLAIGLWVDWAQVFNASEDLVYDLNRLVPVVFIFFGLNMVGKLITTMYLATQNHSIEGKIGIYTQGLTLLSIFLLTRYADSSLLLFGLIVNAIPVLILAVLSWAAFRGNFAPLRPSFRSWNRVHLGEMAGLGGKFLIIQIATIVLFSTDNFIITRILGPEEVVPYQVAFKYFSVVTMGYTILLGPYWSSFTEAYAKQDLGWIRNSVGTIQKIWLGIPLVLLLLYLGADHFYLFWVGDEVVVPRGLSAAMALFVLLMTFNMVYVNFINGVGKVKLQLYTSMFTMLINIPLSIFFAKTLELGATGVILATCCCFSYSVILRPLQYYKIMSGKASGIWMQ